MKEDKSNQYDTRTYQLSLFESIIDFLHSVFVEPFAGKSEQNKPCPSKFCRWSQNADKRHPHS